MKKPLLASAVFFTLLSVASAEAKSPPCSVDSLGASYRQRLSKGDDVSHLQKKTWWTRCPISIRKSVYASLLASLASSLPPSPPPPVAMRSALPVLRKAPELQGLGQWFNSDPLTLASLSGKVVLVHFWTFECINCIHTLPAAKSYWDKYADKPFVILGIHTPELTFEKSAQNLQDAIKRDGLTYPIVQDNDFATWNAYENQYWPAFYLIDAEGNIRYQHFGEGEYDTIDANIKALLREVGA